MPEGYWIEKACAGDSGVVAGIHVDCWRSTYIGIVPDGKLDTMSYAKSGEKWREFLGGEENTRVMDTVLLAYSDSGEAAGFCAGGMKRKHSKRTEGYEGEIKAVYILRHHQKKGIGTEFMKKFEEIFKKGGIFSYIVWVLKDNPSKEFYKKRGGRLITTKTYDIGGKKLKGLCYGFKIEGT